MKEALNWLAAMVFNDSVTILLAALPFDFDFLATVAASEADRISTSPMGLVRLWDRS